MPDWFYRTVSRPLLFRLPVPQARHLALGMMGTLARLPLGPALIDLLGHMRPDPRLARTCHCVSFPSAVGLGPALDTHAQALPALARFGFGFIEVGPVTARARGAAPELRREPAEQALWSPHPPAALDADDLAESLARTPLALPLIIRLAHDTGKDSLALVDDCKQVVSLLAPHAAFFALPVPDAALDDMWSSERWRELVATVAAGVARLLLVVPADLADADVERLVGPGLEAGALGVVIDGSVRAEPAGRRFGLPAYAAALKLTRRLRECLGPQRLIIGAGGIHEPEQALQFFAAGADLIQLDTGLIYSGPGLPKRVNESILHTHAVDVPPTARPAEMSWFWTALLGAAMLLGAILAIGIAMTRVVLPYDEAFVGMTRDQLAAINDRLLPFLTHDRVSLAGTMIALGILYLGLSLGASRRGQHWAQSAILVSAFAGFASFFLFLAFDYFDPFHAFVTALLFQLVLLGLHARLGPPQPAAVPDLREDWRWRWSQWGQLLFVLQGCSVLGAGLVIATVGATTVFVHEDLEFMNTTPAALVAANPRLLPLVAHDRATFGGMLISCGLTILLTALWGFRRGERWLWWTLFAAGTPAYAAAIAVHLAVGYTHLGHLTPAFLGALLLALGLGLSRPYLCLTEAEVRDEMHSGSLTASTPVLQSPRE